MIERFTESIAGKNAAMQFGSGWYENLTGNMLLRVACMVMLGIIQGCAAVPTNIAAPVPPENVVGHASLAAGRKTYVSLLKCAMCHRPKPVSDFSAEMWTEEILPKMSKKARLSPQEYANVLAYVTTTANSTQIKVTEIESK